MTFEDWWSGGDAPSWRTDAKGIAQAAFEAGWAAREKGHESCAGLSRSTPGTADGALTFAGFSRVNQERCEATSGYHTGVKEYGVATWAMCLAEEMGEVMAAVLGATGQKKRKAHLTAKDVGDELADLVAYADLLAHSMGLDLGACVAEKWDRVSERIGYAGRLEATPATPSPVPTTAYDELCVHEGAEASLTCTGLAAMWCPACGSCSCPLNEFSERSRDDDACMLHSPSSLHAEGGTATPLTTRPWCDACNDTPKDGPCHACGSPGPVEAPPLTCSYACTECPLPCAMPASPHPFRDCLCAYHLKREPAEARLTCETCGGRGQVSCSRNGILLTSCAACNGTGKVQP